MNDLKPFDVTEHIRNKVREVLLASIPDDQMDKMIQQEFNAYFHARESYGQTISSPFSAMITAEIGNLARQKLKTWIDNNFESRWDELGGELKLVGEMVDKLAPAVMQSVSRDIVSNVITAIRNSMGR